MRIRLAAATFVLAVVACGALAGPAGAQRALSYVTEPSLTPPELTVNQSSRGQAPGYIFAAVFLNKFLQPPLVGKGGPMIIDNQGRYVWLKNADAKNAPDTLNLQVQRYQGKPVLTYWDGTVSNTGEMSGTWRVLNDRYRQIATIKPQDGFIPSAHEFIIRPNGKVLTTYYRYLPNRDLRSMGGDESDTLLDSGVVEYDLETGKITRTWAADGHIALEDSYAQTRPNAPAAYDPWHINSIDVDAQGNWLISMRNTWAVYKVNPTTGAIVWTLGGKKSTFTFGDNAAFAFQHAARFRPNGQISMFDNNCCRLIPQPSGPPQAGPPVSQKQSRGLVLKLDENAKTATHVMQRTLYDLIAGTQANLQLLSNGNAFIGWGQQPFFSEHDKNGKLLLAVRFPDPDQSYRTYRYRWTGRPATKPKAAARPTGGRTRVYVSWNGATAVTHWRVWAGPSSRRMKVVAKRIAKRGFETSALVRSAQPVVKVQALNARGKVIGTSRAVRRQNTSGNAPAPTY